MSADAETAPPPRRWLAFLPLAAFGLSRGALVSEARGAGDPARIPSALIGQSAPPLTLPGLDGARGADRRRLAHGPCEPGQRVRLLVRALPFRTRIPDGARRRSLAQGQGRCDLWRGAKDSPENIRRFLGAKGDPYAKVGLDADGRAGIDWGVYGVPETFIVKGDGSIAYKVIGPITAEALESEVKPQILKAMN